MPFCSNGVSTSVRMTGRSGTRATTWANDSPDRPEEGDEVDQRRRAVEGGQEVREDEPALLIGGEAHAARVGRLHQLGRRQGGGEDLGPAGVAQLAAPSG